MHAVKRHIVINRIKHCFILVSPLGKAWMLSIRDDQRNRVLIKMAGFRRIILVCVVAGKNMHIVRMLDFLQAMDW